jgi:adenylosuccinate synthase
MVPLSEIVGGFYGDEGKGLVTAYLAMQDRIDAAVRSQGPQAGHTVKYQGKDYVFRQIPSAIFNPKAQLLLAAGAYVNPKVVMEEVQKFELFNVRKRLRIDENATVILPEHVEKEKILVSAVGSVGTGVGGAAADRAMRRPDILVRDVPELKEYSDGVHVSEIVNDLLDERKSVLIEGAHSTHLSNLHGAYPYTNAYDNTASALLDQVGVGPKAVDNIYVIFKAFVSRVGKGPLNGELSEAEADKLGWVEHGTVSGRRRRAAPFDVELAKKSVRLNTPTDIVITKLDIVYPGAAGVREYGKLPKEAKERISYLEKELKVPITLLKTGPELNDMIDLRKEKGTVA